VRDDQLHTTETARQQMLDWYSQRPSLVLMGEFSAGKSTLLNVLLGQQVLTAMVTATKLPVVWITHGATQASYGLTYDGQLHALTDVTPDRVDWERYLLVRMTLDAPLLQHCDVIDTPGISDPRLAVGSLRVIADFADFAIWCSAANQAWRQSEKAAWTALPARLRDNSILAVTRMDMLPTPSDVAKVLKRLTRETDGLFATICPIASLQAMQAAGDPQAW
jgi:GTPase Era involved in 16S rRNA processing